MKYYSIQMMRFIAAMFVLLFHLDILDAGLKGVDLFFVISGFVMYINVFCPNRPAANHFFINRLTKIFFLYWIALLSIYFVRSFPLDGAVIGTILLVPGHIPWLKVSWSLSYELYFYILTGVIAYSLTVKYSKAVFLLLLIASSLITTLYLAGQIQIKGSLLNFLLGKNAWEFLLGMLSGYLSLDVLKSFRVPVVLPASLMLMVLLYVILVPVSTRLLPTIVMGMLCMMLICFITACEKNTPAPQKPAVLFKILGDSSYAMYLFAPVIDTLITERSTIAKITLIISSVCLAVLINQLIENKGLPWCRKMMYKLVN